VKLGASREAKLALDDVARSARLWRIWVRLGLQDVRYRFRRSAIGVWWIFLNLAVLILSVGYIYGNLLGQNLREFIPYLTVGLVTWGYLLNSIAEGGNAFVGSEGYIKQISLPIYVYIFRFFVSISLTALISFAAFWLVAIVYGVQLNLGTLWALPGWAILMTVSLLLITILAHLNARFRDAAHLASIGMQVMFYVTPVLYPADLLRERGLGAIIDLNPLYHLLEVIRRPLLSAAPAGPVNYLVAGLVIVALAGAAATVIGIFRRRIVYAL